MLVLFGDDQDVPARAGYKEPSLPKWKGSFRLLAYVTMGLMLPAFSQKKYKEDAEKSMSYYETVLDTPEMQRVRENQKNFSLVSFCSAEAQPTGGGTAG